MFTLSISHYIIIFMETNKKLTTDEIVQIISLKPIYLDLKENTFIRKYIIVSRYYELWDTDKIKSHADSTIEKLFSLILNIEEKDKYGVRTL